VPSYKQAFLEAYNANPSLVGAPREDDQDMGVRNVSQQVSENGVLTWADVKDVGQIIYFTEWDSLDRYIFQGGTWRKLGGSSGSSGQADGGVILTGPTAPDISPLPAPDGAIVLPSGLTVFQPQWLQPGVVVAGAGVGRTVLQLPPGDSLPLFSGQYAAIQDVTLDGNELYVRSTGRALIDVNVGQTLRRVEVRNFRDLGINAGGGLIEDFIISGVAPVGRDSDVSYMGLHTGTDCKRLVVRRGRISGCAANGIFNDGDGEVFEDIELVNNHRSAFPFGGGQVDASGNSRNATYLRVYCNGSDGPVASGWELNGTNHQLTDCGSRDHANYGYFGQQGGPFTLVRCSGKGNRENVAANEGVRIVQVDCRWI
jgi:hypothetical protein